MLKLNFIWLIGLTILHSFKCLQDFEIEAIPEDVDVINEVNPTMKWKAVKNKSCYK